MSRENGKFTRIGEVGGRAAEIVFNIIVIKPLTLAQQRHERQGTVELLRDTSIALFLATAAVATGGEIIGPSNISVTYPMILIEGGAFYIFHRLSERGHNNYGQNSST